MKEIFLTWFPSNINTQFNSCSESDEKVLSKSILRNTGFKKKRKMNRLHMKTIKQKHFNSSDGRFELQLGETKDIIRIPIPHLCHAYMCFRSILNEYHLWAILIGNDKAIRKCYSDVEYTMYECVRMSWRMYINVCMWKSSSFNMSKWSYLQREKCFTFSRSLDGIGN